MRAGTPNNATTCVRDWVLDLVRALYLRMMLDTWEGRHRNLCWIALTALGVHSDLSWTEDE